MMTLSPLSRVKTKFNNNRVWYYRHLFVLISFAVILQENKVVGKSNRSNDDVNQQQNIVEDNNNNGRVLNEEEGILHGGDISQDEVDELDDVLDGLPNKQQQQEQQQQEQQQQEQQQQQKASPTMTDTRETQASNSAGEESLLDLFGESAVDYLTHRLIPTTDASCRWDWRNLRCESHCDCTFQPTWGDYHLGRSCRARSTPLPIDKIDLCHLPPDNDNNPLHHVRNAIHSARHRVEPIMRKVNLDWSGRMALVKGEVCESWLSSAVEEMRSGVAEENEGPGLPLYDEAVHGTAYATPTGATGSSDGRVLSKPIRKLRKLFHCEALV